MIRKLSFFFALVSLFSIALFAQQLPEGQKKAAKKIEGFSFIDGGGFLGIEVIEVTKENIDKLGLSAVKGVAIERVLKDSPAEKAGLQKGDVVISINGEEVTSVRKFQRLIYEIAPDHQAKIVALRSGNESEFMATMGKRPMPQFSDGNFRMNFPMERFPSVILESPAQGQFERFPKMGGEVMVLGGGESFVFGANRRIGITTIALTKQLGEHYGVGDGKGLLITEVRENSPAAKAGLMAGDVIIEAEGKTTSTQIELIKAINEKKEGSISITIMRNKQRQSISLTPEKIQMIERPKAEY